MAALLISFILIYLLCMEDILTAQNAFTKVRRGLFMLLIICCYAVILVNKELPQPSKEVVVDEKVLSGEPLDLRYNEQNRIYINVTDEAGESYPLYYEDVQIKNRAPTVMKVVKVVPKWWQYFYIFQLEKVYISLE